MKIGDRVKFINDVGAGTVVKIEGTIITVDREDGFEIPTLISELVVVEKEEELRAISRIGVSDIKPGRRKKGDPIAPKTEKKLKAYTRFGKVALVDDYEDDEPIDIASIRENYARNMASVNRVSTEFLATPKNDTSVFDSKETRKAQEAEYDIEAKRAKENKAAVEKIENIEFQREDFLKDVKKEKAPTPPKGGIEVIDLHSHNILESEQGMSSGDILEFQIKCFVEELDKRIASRQHGKVVFIHGVGSGKLKYELTKRLKSHYPSIYHQDASFQEYGYGAILVMY